MHRLKTLQNAYEGQTCLILGNGPSLADVLDQLKVHTEIKQFGANMIINDHYPHFVTCVDRHMVHSFVPKVDVEKAELTFIGKGIPLKGAVPLNVVVDSGFSFDPTERVIIGGTVTYVNLQLALYMGFRTALLVGMDHHYPGAGSRGRPGSTFIQDGPDKDHYSENYFERGKIYARPELDAVAKYTYQTALNAWASVGGRIINCSTFTKLEVFERGKLEDYL